MDIVNQKMEVRKNNMYPRQRALTESEKSRQSIDMADMVVVEHKYHCATQDLNLIIKTYHEDLEALADAEFYIEKNVRSILRFCDKNCKYLKDSF